MAFLTLAAAYEVTPDRVRVLFPSDSRTAILSVESPGFEQMAVAVRGSSASQSDVTALCGYGASIGLAPKAALQFADGAGFIALSQAGYGESAAFQIVLPSGEVLARAAMPSGQLLAARLNSNGREYVICGLVIAKERTQENTRVLREVGNAFLHAGASFDGRWANLTLVTTLPTSWGRLKSMYR